MDVEGRARADAQALVVYAFRERPATAAPLRRRYFELLDRVISQFPGAPSKKLVSRMYRDAFFSELQRILGGGAGSFWLYMNSIHDDVGPLLVTVTLVIYVLAFMAGTYVVGVSPQLFIVSTVVYPTALAALGLTAFLAYLYVRYRHTLEEARLAFRPLLDEWETLGYVLAPSPPPYEL